MIAGWVLNWAAYRFSAVVPKSLPSMIMLVSFSVNNTSDENSSACFSFSNCSTLYSMSSRKMSFFPCSRICPISWKNENQNVSYLLLRPESWIQGILLIHLAEPLIGAFFRHGVYMSLIPHSAHKDCNCSGKFPGFFRISSFIANSLLLSSLSE